MPNHAELIGGDATSLPPAHTRAPLNHETGRSACAGPRNAGVTVATGARPVRKSGRAQGAPQTVAPEQVLQSFNTWAFKREQPDDPALMLRVISKNMACRQPISFVLYWGKGPRCEVDAPDRECLDYLAALAGRVRAVYEPGAAITLIFTDTHAALNGHASQAIQHYFAAIEAAAAHRGFTCCWLSTLLRAARLEHATENIADETPDESLRRLLVASAAKWYQGEATAEQAALRYYRMNMIEKQAVALAFPDAIFVTFNDRRFRSLFPRDLPVFYMYSLRRGISSKPWFLSSASAAGEGPPGAALRAATAEGDGQRPADGA